ncbi:MAG: HAD-IIIA family hydrolase [bacterium]|nr:HAD-IIIA family hydrolase [bacterium]
MNTRKIALFIDRDGVINDTVDRGEVFFVKGKKVRWTAPFNREEFKFKPGVHNALAATKSLGYMNILVTNQPDVGYGNMTVEEHDHMMFLVRQLPLDDIYICLHTRFDTCGCKKPLPGMITEAAIKWDIDLPRSFVVGDTANDVGAGKAAGCRTIILDHPYNQDVATDVRLFDLQELVRFLSRTR